MIHGGNSVSIGSDPNGKMNPKGYTSAGVDSGSGITGPTGIQPQPRPQYSFPISPYLVHVQ